MNIIQKLLSILGLTKSQETQKTPNKEDINTSNNSTNPINPTNSTTSQSNQPTQPTQPIQPTPKPTVKLDSEIFKSIISESKFNSLFPKAKPNTYKTMSELLVQNNIDTTDRINMFLAQCSHESSGFSVNIENLNYSAQGLLITFPKYFPTLEVANQYARQPEKIASKIYANRMNNGNEASKDGWNYKGRGFIQLTGKYNYEQFSIATNIDCVNNPELLESVELSVKSAIWFWNKNNLNSYSDRQDIIGATKKINGGTNGINDRTRIYNLLQS